MFTRRSPTFLIVRFNYNTARYLAFSFFFFNCIYLISSTRPPPLCFGRWTLGLIRLCVPLKSRPLREALRNVAL